MRVTDIDKQWHLDLADVSNLKKQNDGYRFLLCVMDVLSKIRLADSFKTENWNDSWIAKKFQTRALSRSHSIVLG